MKQAGESPAAPLEPVTESVLTERPFTMQQISGWLVQTSRGIHGPFPDASAAARYIEANHRGVPVMAGPFAILPVYEPRRMAEQVNRKSKAELFRESMERQRRVEPFDDGWSA